MGSADWIERGRGCGPVTKTVPDSLAKKIMDAMLEVLADRNVCGSWVDVVWDDTLGLFEIDAVASVVVTNWGNVNAGAVCASYLEMRAQQVMDLAWDGDWATVSEELDQAKPLAEALTKARAVLLRPDLRRALTAEGFVFKNGTMSYDQGEDLGGEL